MDVDAQSIEALSKLMRSLGSPTFPTLADVDAEIDRIMERPATAIEHAFGRYMFIYGVKVMQQRIITLQESTEVPR